MRYSIYPKSAKKVGQKLLRARLHRGCKLTDISDKVPITESYLSRIEQGRQLPSPNVLVAICGELEFLVSEVKVIVNLYMKEQKERCELKLRKKGIRDYML